MNRNVKLMQVRSNIFVLTASFSCTCCVVWKWRTSTKLTSGSSFSFANVFGSAIDTARWYDSACIGTTATRRSRCVSWCRYACIFCFRTWTLLCLIDILDVNTSFISSLSSASATASTSTSIQPQMTFSLSKTGSLCRTFHFSLHLVFRSFLLYFLIHFVLFSFSYLALYICLNFLLGRLPSTAAARQALLSLHQTSTTTQAPMSYASSSSLSSFSTTTTSASSSSNQLSATGLFVRKNLTLAFLAVCSFFFLCSLLLLWFAC